MDAAGPVTEAPAPVSRRSRGFRFIALGIILLAIGVLAILLPDAATTATGTGLGSLGMLGGVVVIAQTLRDRTWHGFRWQLLFGAAEVVGGLLIIVKPMKGAAAVALAVPAVLAVQGVTQLGPGLRIRPGRGWWGPVVPGRVTPAAPGPNPPPPGALGMGGRIRQLLARPHG
ncbi:DUF308 domain-containing protein, partial [Nostoc sp. NIES-2111]